MTHQGAAYYTASVLFRHYIVISYVFIGCDNVVFRISSRDVTEDAEKANHVEFIF